MKKRALGKQQKKILEIMQEDPTYPWAAAVIARRLKIDHAAPVLKSLRLMERVGFKTGSPVVRCAGTRARYRWRLCEKPLPIEKPKAKRRTKEGVDIFRDVILNPPPAHITVEAMTDLDSATLIGIISGAAFLEGLAPKELLARALGAYRSQKGR